MKYMLLIMIGMCLSLFFSGCNSSSNELSKAPDNYVKWNRMMDQEVDDEHLYTEFDESNSNENFGLPDTVKPSNPEFGDMVKDVEEDFSTK